jgi:hypothetical protein
MSRCYLAVALIAVVARTAPASAELQEIAAAGPHARAAAQRPAIVLALEDPIILPWVDHFPFMMHDEGQLSVCHSTAAVD